MIPRNLWSKILIVAGGIGMLVGAIDPLEGSLLILPGSGLLVVGTYLGQAERRLVTYRATAFILIAIGVAALWGLSVVGGFGGPTGRSMWWGLLILPYQFGWLMAIWGPGNPRWFSWLGMGVGLWYLVLSQHILTRQSLAQQAQGGSAILVVLAAMGILAMAGCIYRLSRGMKTRAMRTNTTT